MEGFLEQSTLTWFLVCVCAFVCARMHACVCLFVGGVRGLLPAFEMELGRAMLLLPGSQAV